MTSTRIAIMLAGAGTGLVVGALVAVKAFELGGAGHGWTAPGPSVTALIGFPLLGAAMAVPRPIRRGFLQAALVIPLWADMAIGLEAWGENVAYFRRMWARAPQAVILWAALWFGWQAAGLGVLIADRRARRRERSES